MQTKLHSLFIVLALLAGVHRSTAQGTMAFTYQGQLHDSGTNANGTYTMVFKLYDSLSGGNQIGSGITNSPSLVNGLFSVNLDFGAGVFNSGARWLDITVSNGVVQTLSPRVQLLPAPYALYSSTAATASNALFSASSGSAVSLTGTNGASVVANTNNGLTVNGGLNVGGALAVSNGQSFTLPPWTVGVTNFGSYTNELGFYDYAAVSL